jgi:hypothetical protein
MEGASSSGRRTAHSRAAGAPKAQVDEVLNIPYEIGDRPD